LIHSTGGWVSDGIVIHNYLRTLPVELVTYNSGAVSSIAVLVYLAGRRRVVNGSATFMIHKSTLTFPAPTTAEQIQKSIRALKIEDRRSEDILRQHINLPPKRWQVHKRGDLILTAQESVQFGLAHTVGDFAPPAGSKLFTV